MPANNTNGTKVSQQFLDTLVNSDQKVVRIAQVWNGNTPLAQLGTVTAGSVNVDVTQQVRRTCTVTIESQGLSYDDLVPTSAKSLLHPASGNELRLFRGFEYADETTEMCSLGVFRMTKPVVDDTGDAITIAVTGNDRSSLVSRRKWTEAYPINPGTDVRTAIFNLFQNRVPDLGLTYRLSSTPGITVPSTTFGADLSGSNDPMADAISLATAVPMELFFDYNGALVLQTTPIPDISRASFGFSYAEGKDCTVTDIQRTFDETVTNNGVVVIGVGSGGAPITAEVWDTDPASPLYAGPRGINGQPVNGQPYIYQTTLVPSTGQGIANAQQQLNNIAAAIYRQVHTLYDIPQISAVANPALLEDDIIELIRERIGLSGPYVIGQLAIPFDIATQETITGRSPTVTIPAQG